MKTILILVGKTADKHFQAGISDYAQRICHYMPFDIVTIPELRNTKEPLGRTTEDGRGRTDSQATASL